MNPLNHNSLTNKEVGETLVQIHERNMKNMFKPFTHSKLKEVGESIKQEHVKNIQSTCKPFTRPKLNTETWQDRLLTKEEYKGITSVIANMVFGFNGSDKTNPKMKGLKYATETLKETIQWCVDTALKSYSKDMDGVINDVYKNFSHFTRDYKEVDAFRDQLSQQKLIIDKSRGIK